MFFVCGSIFTLLSLKFRHGLTTAKCNTNDRSASPDIDLYMSKICYNIITAIKTYWFSKSKFKL